jgi:2-polyprenyl-3-methyl-5-hydroxy-6-metoxy-1,4-benzoquinol methylase
MSGALASKMTQINTPDVWEKVWQEQSYHAYLEWVVERELRLMRWGYFKRLVEKEFGSLEGLSAIELGAGRGIASLYLALQGANITLVDWSESALESSRVLFSEFGLEARTIKANILEIPASEAGKYDLSVSVGVAEHFVGADRQAVIRSHATVLKPGGLALISVPNALCVPYRAWMYLTKRRQRWKFGLEVPFQRSALEMLAREAELEPIVCVGSSLKMAFSDFWIYGYGMPALARITGVNFQKRRAQSRLGQIAPFLLAEQERFWDHHIGYFLNLIARRREIQSR